MAAGAFQIRVLGPLEVAVDRDALPFTRERERLLLALLAARAPASVSAAQLIEDLWGDSSPAGAHTTLRAYVSSLRRTLRRRGQDGLIVTRRYGYALEAVAADSEQFIARMASAEALRRRGHRAGEADTLEQALGLWRGRAFEEIASVPAVVPVAYALEEQRLVALERWSAAELACGRHLELAARLSAECDAHPTRERLWAYRMRALYRSGRHAEALEAYRELYRRLRDGLGIEPSSELRSLELAILHQDRSLDGHTERDRMPPGVPAPLQAPIAGTFVGRRAELDALATCSALARSGASHLLVVSGEAGVGKTRLVGEWAQRDHDHGSFVLYGRCDRSDSTPYQPFVEALGPYLSTRVGRQVADPIVSALFPGLDAEPAPAALTSGDLRPARWRLFDAITELVVALAAQIPLTLILDDLHRADASTLELLAHLVRRAGQVPLLVLVTCRADAGVGHATMADLAQDPGFKTLELGGLSEDEVAELTAASPVVGVRDLAPELHRVSGGSPLLVRQTLAQLELAGHGGDVAALPEALFAGLNITIATRLESLSAQELEVLTTAALLGEEFELTELEVVEHARNGECVLDVVEASLRRNLISAVHGSLERYHFGHPLLRQGLFDRLSAPRRARLHERIGAALAELPDPDGRRSISLAGHFAVAPRPGHVGRAADSALRGARHALAQLAFDEAEAAAERGLRCLAIEQRNVWERRHELQLLLAQSRAALTDANPAVSPADEPALAEG